MTLTHVSMLSITTNTLTLSKLSWVIVSGVDIKIAFNALFEPKVLSDNLFSDYQLF